MREAVNRISWKVFSTQSEKKVYLPPQKIFRNFVVAKIRQKAFYYLVLLFYFSMQDHKMEKKFIFR